MNHSTTTVAQGMLRADIPSTPAIEPTTRPTSPGEALTASLASEAQDTLAQAQALSEPGETDSTIRLPQKLTRQKSAARKGARSKVTSPLPENAVGLIDAPREPGESESTIRLFNRKRLDWSQGQAESLSWLHRNARKHLQEDLLGAFDEALADDLDDEEAEHHGTWQKVIEHKTTHPVAVVPQKGTASLWKRLLYGRTARSFFWLSTLIMIALLLSGAFGLAASFGRTTPKAVPNAPPSLLASPTTITLGGIVTLRGMHFTPEAQIVLSHDRQFPLLDTSDENTIHADAQGQFSDTFVVDPIWGSGAHILTALDVHTHKQAQFPLLVTGQISLQGPPHLLLSASTLDLGSGDDTMNANQLLALSNAGGGVVTWQATSSAGWLQTTPQNGSVASGKHTSVIVVADRSNLAPGSYQATLSFTTNTGVSVVTVNLAVTALQTRHEAVLQLSPATLAFNGIASGSGSGDQAITIYNPGSQPLTWGAGISNSNWLWASPAGGTIAAGSSQQITVGVNPGQLGTGVYRGTITFSNQGSLPIQGSPQSVYVSLTVSPACVLKLSTNGLSFTATHGGAAPANQSLNIGVTSGCVTKQHWSAKAATASGGSWLSISAASGTAPSTLTVSAHTSGLAAGTYQGSVIITDNLGSQKVGVTLTVAPAPCKVSAGSSALALQGTAGQSGPLVAGVTLSASGDCSGSLNWSTSASGGSWLSAASSGSFTSSTTVNVQASLAGLSAGTYNGDVKITVVDSTTGQTVGTFDVAVKLTAQPQTPPATPCTLVDASPTGLSFDAKEGADPITPTATFTVSVTGTCSGNITITPAVDSGGGGWLTVSGPVSIASGSGATFTITVSSAALKAGTYSSTISLSASNGIAGSPRSVTVALTVTAVSPTPSSSVVPK